MKPGTLLFWGVLFCFVLGACNNSGTLTEKDVVCRNFMTKDIQEFYIGKHTRILEKADSFLSANPGSSPICRMDMYFIKCRYYINSYKNDTALLYADSIIYVLERNKINTQHINSYIAGFGIRGEINYASGNFEAAYNDYFKAKSLAEQSNNICLSVSHCYGLGMISYKQKKYNDAINYFRSSFLYNSQCKEQDLNNMQEVLDNIALCFDKLNLPDSALYYYDSAFSFIQHRFNKFQSPLFIDKGVGVIYGNIGSIYLAKGNLDTAISFFKRSYALNIRPLYEQGDALLIHIKLADAYLRKNDLPALVDALPMIRKEMDSIKHSGSVEKDWNDLLYRYYEKTGNPAEALKYHKIYSDLKDSLNIAVQKELRSDVSKALQQKEQSYQIGILQKQNKLNNVYLWVTIVVLLMAFVIIGQIYLNNKKSRKNIDKLTLLNNQVSDQKTELEKKNMEKDKILHIVAHDLRNPVGSVLYLATEMKTENAADWANEDVFGMIKTASESAMTLITELLGHSNDINNELTKEPVDINKLVGDTVKLLQFKANEKHQDLQAEIPSDPAIININKEQITRVVGNLVTNAMKFSKENTTISVTLTQHAKKVVIAVKDSGIGIPEHLQDKVFNMFTDAKRKGTSGEKSYGLGLSICKQIVEAHGGSIRFESEVGVGTTFFVELPV